MATSLKDYLKKYQSIGEDDKKQPKKTKKKRNVAQAKVPLGLVIVDNDSAWQKPVDEDSDEPEVEGIDAPQVIEDVEVKRMHQMERIKLHRPYMSIGDDGSGWSTVEKKSKDGEQKQQTDDTLRSGSPDISPPRRNGRPGSPDASPPRRRSQVKSGDISPPRRRNARAGSSDASPPRRRTLMESEDISPPRRRNARAGSSDASPPRRRSQVKSEDISPPRRRNARAGPPNESPPRKRTLVELDDISPPRRRNARADSPDASPPRRPLAQSRDISPPRRKKSRADFHDSLPLRIASPSQSEDISPPRKKKSRNDSSPRRKPVEQNLNPSVGSKQVKMTDGRQAGLITDKAERVAELAKKKQEDARRLKEMGGGGRAAETVYRDKRGKRLEGLEELLRQQQGEAKPEAKPLEWGKGLAQKREVEERHAEFEAEKNKPFARTRDDPEYDKMFKERLRWGDPMAHLVKKKDPAAELVDFGASDEMKESGFIIPQDIPAHSWLKRGVGAPMNRYGIRPGRHWDGVDRSTGFENQMFKAKAEKRATEMEAYLWSVADM